MRRAKLGELESDAARTIQMHSLDDVCLVLPNPVQYEVDEHLDPLLELFNRCLALASTGREDADDRSFSSLGRDGELKRKRQHSRFRRQ